MTWCFILSIFSNPWAWNVFKNADLWIGNVFSTTLLYRWKHNLKINAEIKCSTLTFLSWCFCLLFCIHRNTVEGKIWVNYISWWTLVVTFHKWSICYPGTVWWVWWKALLMQHLHQYNVPNTCIWFMKEVKSAPVSEWFSPREDFCWKTIRTTIMSQDNKTQIIQCSVTNMHFYPAAQGFLLSL